MTKSLKGIFIYDIYFRAWHLMRSFFLNCWIGALLSRWGWPEYDCQQASSSKNYYLLVLFCLFPHDSIGSSNRRSAAGRQAGSGWSESVRQREDGAVSARSVRGELRMRGHALPWAEAKRCIILLHGWKTVQPRLRLAEARPLDFKGWRKLEVCSNQIKDFVWSCSASVSTLNCFF